MYFFYGTANSDFPRTWPKEGFPEELEDKVVASLHCEGLMVNQNKRGTPWRCLLTPWVHHIVGWLSQLAHKKGSVFYGCGFSRGAMWLSDMLHRNPLWVDGALLCGGYPF